MASAKTIWFGLFAAAALTAPLGAAEPPGPTTHVEVSPALAMRVDEYISFQAGLPGRIFGINVKYTGVVPMLVKAKQPLQLINPLAPMEYGDGYQNVILDPVSKRPEGVTLLQVRF